MEGTAETPHRRPSCGANPHNEPELSPETILLGPVTVTTQPFFSVQVTNPMTEWRFVCFPKHEQMKLQRDRHAGTHSHICRCVKYECCSTHRGDAHTYTHFNTDALNSLISCDSPPFLPGSSHTCFSRSPLFFSSDAVLLVEEQMGNAKKVDSPFKTLPIICRFMQICKHPKAAFRNLGGYLLSRQSYVNTRLNHLLQFYLFCYFFYFRLEVMIRLCFYKLQSSFPDSAQQLCVSRNVV